MVTVPTGILYYFRSVSRAVQNLVQPDVLQSQAVDVRMELDLRIGTVNFKVFFYHKIILLTKCCILTTKMF